MILVIYFDAVQSMLGRERAQQRRGWYVLAASSPRVSDDRHSSGGVHQVDASLQLDGIALHVCRPTLGQESVEGLLTVTDVTSLDHGVGDVRPTDRRRISNLGHDLGLSHRNAELSQLRQDPG